MSICSNKFNLSISKTNFNKNFEKEFSNDEMNKTVNTELDNRETNVSINANKLKKDLQDKKLNLDEFLYSSSEGKSENFDMTIKDYRSFKNFSVEFNSKVESNTIMFIHKIFKWRKYIVKLEDIKLLGSCLIENSSSLKILNECLNSLSHDTNRFKISEDQRKMDFRLEANLSKNEVNIPVNICFTANLMADEKCLMESLSSLEKIVTKLQENHSNAKSRHYKMKDEILKISREYTTIYEHQIN